MSDVLKPSIRLLVKLGSLIVHYDEMISAKKHEFDRCAIDSLRNDPEVVEWFKGMHKHALLPIKR